MVRSIHSGVGLPVGDSAENPSAGVHEGRQTIKRTRLGCHVGWSEIRSHFGSSHFGSRPYP